MASKYTAADKARVYVLLTVNDRNIKRTSEETGVSRGTILNWVKSWDTNGLEPEVQQLVGESAKDYVSTAERIRTKALGELEKRIDQGELNGRELGIIFGILDDKITRARGLPTRRTEVAHALPSPEEAAELMRGFITGAISQANIRNEDIIDVTADIVEPAALPHSTDTPEE